MAQSEQQQGKGQGDSAKPQDPLLLDRIYKDPLSAFLHKPKSIEDLKEDCLIFLDTNVLLIPYSTSKESLKSFTDIYKTLSDKGRLYLADRVMQEFEKNVPDQLKNIFHNLVLGQNYNAQYIDFPLLDGTEEYGKLKEAEKALQEKLGEYRAATRATLEAIERWDHNDPVRTIYRSVFANARRAQITALKPGDLLKEWEYRQDNKIPPGYKDGGKSDSGIGDYLLWQAVLDTCAKEKKDAIVVSSDAKPDWWHRSDNQPLYARRELVEEFRSATDGATVRLLSPQDFLTLFGATKTIVDEVALEQAQAAEKEVHLQFSTSDTRLRSVQVARRWLMGFIKKQSFGERTNSDLIVETPNGEHYFKFKFFQSTGFGLNQFIAFAKRIADKSEIDYPASTFIMIAGNSESSYKLIKQISGRHDDSFNVIVGIIASEGFTPLYFSNTNQSTNPLI